MDKIEIIPLGGCGEIGKNCTIVKRGDEMVLIDCGISFPHEEHYGVDIVIPDFTYLIENQDKLKGIILTHAHEDHVGALAFLLPEVDVPLYATRFTSAMIMSKLRERMRHFQPEINEFEPGSDFEVGGFEIRSVLVTHSIPETCAIAIKTEYGHILFTADFKFDFTPVDGKLTQLDKLTQLGEEGVVALLCDCTNVDRRGWSTSESEVTKGLEKVFRDAPGRVLVTTFASNIHRMEQVINTAHKVGRKAAVAGRRMENTIDMCLNMGYMKIPRGALIPLDDVNNYPKEEIVMLTTGSQGEPMAALSQMSRGEYSRMRIQEGDTILYSARPIPGNEGAIWRTVNRIYRMGAHVIVDSVLPIHVSGHGHQDEMKMMVNLTKPYYVLPVHGEPRHQSLFRDVLNKMGYENKRVFLMENGDQFTMDKETAWLDRSEVASGEILIDQSGNVPVRSDVLRERASLGHEGAVMIALSVDTDAGEIVGRPTIESRGFSGPPEALDRALEFVGNNIGKLSGAEIRDEDYLKKAVREAAQAAIAKTCQQKPTIFVALSESARAKRASR